MKKIKIFCLLLCLLFVPACGQDTGIGEQQQTLGENQIYVYYVNQDKTDVVKEVYSLEQNKKPEENASAIIRMLAKTEATENYQSPIPAGISYVGNHVEDKHGRLEVSFEIVYDKVEADSLLFFKACVVKTLLQLDGVDSIALSLFDLASSNEETATSVENFDQDSFTMSFGNENGYRQKGTIVLYFANASGGALKEYRKSIEIANNSSLARMVVEALIEGPEGEEYTRTLPESTTIRNVSVKDGICYVDLSDEFYNTDNPLKNDVIVYSIVNSLAELPTVSKVQFLRNGEKQPYFRETLAFDGIFERNLDLVEQEDREY
ncbi:MAG: GerMN domain-containing protein [Bacteroidales bacterium]|nr:GerMN domain-containing protein [Clostridium sp.]MCM1202566.1 GerMN domain-containing protein [Bacteroidales bacterium]